MKDYKHLGFLTTLMSFVSLYYCWLYICRVFLWGQNMVPSKEIQYLLIYFLDVGYLGLNFLLLVVEYMYKKKIDALTLWYYLKVIWFVIVILYVVVLGGLI